MVILRADQFRQSLLALSEHCVGQSREEYWMAIKAGYINEVCT
jgi:hypothetical protein